MKKVIATLILLSSTSPAFAGIRVQVVLPSLDGAKMEKKEPNSEGHAYPYAQTNLSLHANTPMTGNSLFVDGSTPKNNTQQDKLGGFTVTITGKTRIGKLESALKECIDGGAKMKATRGADIKAVITADVDELIEGTYGGVAISGSGNEGDARSLVKIDRLDPGRKYAAVTLLNPKSLSCKFLSAKVPTPKM
jgi:hypothetical protein